MNDAATRGRAIAAAMLNDFGPQSGRRGVGTGSIAAMTWRAGGREKHGGANGVTREGLQWRRSFTFDPSANGHAARQERHVRDEVSHLRARAIERDAIQAAFEAVIDAFLDHHDPAAPNAILRVARMDAHERQLILARAVRRVTTDALKRAPYVRGQAVLRVSEERAAAPNRAKDLGRADFAIGRHAKRNDGRHRGPHLLRNVGRALRAAIGWLTGHERSAEQDYGREPFHFARSLARSASAAM